MTRVLFATLRLIARKVLPEAMRRSLAEHYFCFERQQAANVEKPLARSEGYLKSEAPFFRPDKFDPRSVVQINSGLAPGGVERQIVNTLVQLSRSRPDLKTWFLGLRFGNGPDLDFFRPLLANHPGVVRNAMNFAAARRALRSSVPRAAMRSFKRRLDWMPWDVKEDVLRLMAEFVRIKPGVVHGWQDGAGIPAAYAARLVGVPRIIISTRNLRPTNFVWYRPYMHRAYRELAKCPEVVLVNNSRAGAIDYAEWLDLPVERFAVKRNGVDVSGLHLANATDIAALRKRLNIPANAFVIGSIFRLSEEKRPLLWIQTAREIAKQWPDCHFVIFGEGPLRKELEQFAAHNGVAEYLHCPGTLADTALGLSLFDVFLLTSSFEGTPNAILEASALGIPIVATSAGGVCETVVDGVTGYIVDQPKPDLIAARVLQIARAINWRNQVRTAGPDFVNRCFGLDRMIVETIHLYSISKGEQSFGVYPN